MLQIVQNTFQTLSDFFAVTEEERFKVTTVEGSGWPCSAVYTIKDFLNGTVKKVLVHRNEQDLYDLRRAHIVERTVSETERTPRNQPVIILARLPEDFLQEYHDALVRFFGEDKVIKRAYPPKPANDPGQAQSGPREQLKL